MKLENINYRTHYYVKNIVLHDKKFIYMYNQI